MIIKKYSYRKNFLLNSVFIFLVVCSLVAALVIAYNLTRKYVRNEFETRKIDVFEETIKPYNDFFQNRIPEISFYQGYLDSSSASKFSDTIFKQYPFVRSIVFYDTRISNHAAPNGYTDNHFVIAPHAIVEFRSNRMLNPRVIHEKGSDSRVPLRFMEEFNKMATKFSDYLESADTTFAMTEEESYNVFYNITPGRITFMNVPREEELKVFRRMMFGELPHVPSFEQDVLSFKLDAFGLPIKNQHPRLYQSISIKPLIYEDFDQRPDQIITEFPLSGAFADYKLFFSTSEGHLAEEVSRQYLPSAFIILLIYTVLFFIGYLIYSNLYINSRLYKLQYDFINNLTHEFKTPVSVIKIAGNNIRSSQSLSDRERQHYGKILDEEADKLNELMNKLLSFTQIENQSIKINKEEINLEVFIQNLVDAYQIKYPDFNISYAINRVERFNSDPVLLASLFRNLMDNAYKYSLPKQKELFIGVNVDRGKIYFSFADQGIGIPKAELKNIFQKFYRIQSEYNQQGSVGLGLAFCKELVNFMQGEIFVKSREGIGSEFTVSLPYS